LVNNNALWTILSEVSTGRRRHRLSPSKAPAPAIAEPFLGVVRPVCIFLMSALWLGAKGTVTPETIKLFVIGLPFLLAGTWLGLRFFGRIDEAMFRKIVLALLFISGAVLII
jgi:hypothetical protein